MAVCMCRLRRHHRDSSNGGRGTIGAGGQGSDTNVTSPTAEQMELTVTTTSARPSPHPLQPKVTGKISPQSVVKGYKAKKKKKKIKQVKTSRFLLSCLISQLHTNYYQKKNDSIVKGSSWCKEARKHSIMAYNV